MPTQTCDPVPTHPPCKRQPRKAFKMRLCSLELLSCKDRSTNSNKFRRKRKMVKGLGEVVLVSLRDGLRALEWSQESLFCSDSDPGFCLVQSHCQMGPSPRQGASGGPGTTRQVYPWAWVPRDS